MRNTREKVDRVAPLDDAAIEAIARRVAELLTKVERPQLVSADEVAARLGVERSWVYEQSRLGRIPTVTLGRYRRYRPEAIAAWIEELEASAARR